MNISTNITSKQQRSKRNAAPSSDDSVKRFKTQTTIKTTDDVENNNTGDKPTSTETTHPAKQNAELIENLMDQYCMENIFDSDDETAGCCFDYSYKLSDRK